MHPYTEFVGFYPNDGAPCLLIHATEKSRGMAEDDIEPNRSCRDPHVLAARSTACSRQVFDQRLARPAVRGSWPSDEKWLIRADGSM